MPASTRRFGSGKQLSADAAGYAVASALVFTPLDGVITSIIVLVLILSFIIWRRRNRRKNKGNSVYLFH